MSRSCLWVNSVNVLLFKLVKQGHSDGHPFNSNLKGFKHSKRSKTSFFYM